MHLCATEFLGVNFLADRCLDQCWTREIEPTSFCHKQRVAQDRQVAATRHAVAHDRCDLGNALSAEHRVVPEDATKVICIWKDILLKWKEYASTVHEIDEWKTSTFGDDSVPE